MTTSNIQNLTTVDYKSVNAIHTEYDYRQVVLSLTDSVIYSLNEALDCKDVEFDRDELEELLNDSILHEAIDQSEFVIYNHYHLPIIQYSNNADYYVDNFGTDGLEYDLKNGGLSTLHASIAFWCLYADVQEKLSEVFDEQL